MTTTIFEPAFDERWLDALVHWCELGKAANAGFEDLYLERRLELRLHSIHGASWVEECRTEGAATRWKTATRVLLQAATGTSARTVSRLFSGYVEARELGSPRLPPAPELDVPRGWRNRAEELAEASDRQQMTMRLLLRRAAVIRPDGWHDVRSPLLTHIEINGTQSATYLAVWDRVDMNDIVAALGRSSTRRPFQPRTGNQLPILFSQGTAGVLFHELVGHLLEGDVVAAGTSPLCPIGRRGSWPESLHIVDDPTRFDLPGAFTCDDEGVPAQPLTLIQHGDVAGALCDRESATALACTPGRGRRSTWSSPPVPRLSNLVIAPGAATVDDLRNDIRSGLEVCSLTGATVDPVSGRAVIRVESGWEIRHGRRRRQLARCELTGTVHQILKELASEFGDDPTPDARLGWCVKDGQPLPTGSDAPSLLVQQMGVL